MYRHVLFLLKFYKASISPLFRILLPHSGCRFYPSCSEYSYESILKLGIIKGGLKSLGRIIRCNPLSRGGVDL